MLLLLNIMEGKLLYVQLVAFEIIIENHLTMIIRTLYSHKIKVIIRMIHYLMCYCGVN